MEHEVATGIFQELIQLIVTYTLVPKTTKLAQLRVWDLGLDEVMHDFVHPLCTPET